MDSVGPYRRGKPAAPDPDDPFAARARRRQALVAALIVAATAFVTALVLTGKV